MRPLHLAIPVLTRYDCLEGLLQSAVAGTRRPDHVWIVDNGAQLPALRTALVDLPLAVTLHLPGVNLGLAASWNWLLRAAWGVAPAAQVVVANDDLVFAPTSLATIAAVTAPFASALAGSNAFSCYWLTPETFAQIGPFDEGISPGYAYFEDNDYAFRLAEAGIPITAVDAGVGHVGSQTLAAYTPAEQTAHHAKFERAKANFRAKWGCLPADRVVPQVTWPTTRLEEGR